MSSFAMAVLAPVINIGIKINTDAVVSHPQYNIVIAVAIEIVHHPGPGAIRGNFVQFTLA